MPARVEQSPVLAFGLFAERKVGILVDEEVADWPVDTFIHITVVEDFLTQEE
jgi:hypothetical protein